MNCKSPRFNWKKTTFLTTAISIACGFTSVTKAATLADIALPEPAPPIPNPNNSTTTPEPMSILGLVSVGFIGLIRRKKIGL